MPKRRALELPERPHTMSTRRLRLTLAAALVTVAALGLTGVPARAEPTAPATTAPATSGGAISGRLMDGDVGVAGASVSAITTASPWPVQTVVTDADGRFRLADLRPFNYKVRFVLPGGLLTQYYPGWPDLDSADILTLPQGAERSIVEQVVEHGSLGGHITTATGAPAPRAWLTLVDSQGQQRGTAEADAAGAYRFGYLPVGPYRLSVAASRVGAPTQWLHGHLDRVDADAVTVNAGPQTTVDERLLPLGEISGTFTEAGRPLAVSVEADSTTDSRRFVSVAAGADGRWRLRAYPGTYRILFRLPDGRLDQWWRGSDSEAGADTVTVTAGGAATADDEALPAGRAGGVLRNADGTPASWVGVVLTATDTGRQYQATTLGSGEWQVVARPGTYRLQFDGYGQTQWYHHRTDPAAADPVVVTAGAVTTVDETLLAPGRLDVTATDAATGTPVATFCATANGTSYRYLCTSDGTVSFDLGEGTYTVTVDDSVHFAGSVSGVHVTSGGHGAVAVALRHGATVEVTVVDARTGQPVAGACVDTQPVARPPRFAEYNHGCTDAAGRVTVSRVRPDRYTLFAFPYDLAHGAQWVGRSGGVGSQAAAKVFTLRAGVTTPVRVRLDGRGSVSGVITDRATRRPLAGSAATAGGVVAAVDGSGRYTMDGLGPYPWVVLFNHPGRASQWSGGGTDRRKATPVRVRVDRTTRYDVALRRGTAVTGTVLGPDGRPPQSASVSVLNADTFDVMARVEAGPDGRYVARVGGPQRVKVVVIGDTDGGPVYGWHPAAADFADARTVSVPASGTVRADVTVAPLDMTGQ